VTVRPYFIGGIPGEIWDAGAVPSTGALSPVRADGGHDDHVSAIEVSDAAVETSEGRSAPAVRIGGAELVDVSPVGVSLSDVGPAGSVDSVSEGGVLVASPSALPVPAVSSGAEPVALATGSEGALCRAIPAGAGAIRSAVSPVPASAEVVGVGSVVWPVVVVVSVPASAGQSVVELGAVVAVVVWATAQGPVVTVPSTALIDGAGSVGRFAQAGAARRPHATIARRAARTCIARASGRDIRPEPVQHATASGTKGAFATHPWAEIAYIPGAKLAPRLRISAVSRGLTLRKHAQFAGFFVTLGTDFHAKCGMRPSPNGVVPTRFLTSTRRLGLRQWHRLQFAETVLEPCEGPLMEPVDRGLRRVEYPRDLERT
jgi:hypothetical protein